MNAPQQVTTAIRFKADDVRRTVRADGNWWMAGRISAAQQTDGFPHSYTPEAVEAGRRLLIVVAAEKVDWDEAKVIGRTIDDLQRAERWYAHSMGVGR